MEAIPQSFAIPPGHGAIRRAIYALGEPNTRVSLFETLADPGDSDAVRAVSLVFAGIERDLNEAVREHYGALGIEPPEAGPPAEQRAEELVELVSHHVAGDLWTYFLDVQAPEGLKNGESAQAFAGQTEAEWQADLERLAKAAPDDVDGSVRERADSVVRNQFGLGLETFESELVGWSPERTLRRALREQIDADIERIKLATEAVERSKEGREERGRGE